MFSQPSAAGTTSWSACTTIRAISPLKTVGFVYDREKQEWKAVEGVNVTLGLPIIRASVDHGTDFYHAGKGNGNELSLVNAIKYAVKMTGREA